MVALIVGLKWQLLRNGLRRSTPQLVGMIIGAVYGLSVIAVAVSGLVALRFAVPSPRRFAISPTCATVSVATNNRLALSSCLSFISYSLNSI